MKIHKILRFTIILFLIAAWVFSGFPRIWENSAVPLEIKEARAVPEGLAPDAILAITELSPNDVTYIQDDPDSPDEDWLVASGNNINTDVRVSFPTPTGNPIEGADLQEFRASVKKYSATQTGTPKARMELWENGVLIRAGSDVDVASAVGQIISFTWNANELGNADGSLVECKVVGIKSGRGPTARNTVDVGAVEWNAEYVYIGSVFSQSAFRWFNNTDTTDVGDPLAAQDIAATLDSAGAAFRLRMLLHISNSQLDSSGQDFKLQFSQRFDTCDSPFGDGGTGVVTGDSDSNTIYGIAKDSTYMYLAGRDDNIDWRIEKRLLSDGSLDSGFGTDGVVTGAAASDDTDAIVIDSDYMYLSGNDDNTDWRIEKRLLSDGSLVTAFGIDGVATSTGSDGQPQDIAIDDTYMYVFGYDASPGDWRIEKRLLSDGSLDSGFGTDGVVTGATESKWARAIEIDSTYMYLGGQGADWRIEKRLLSDGSLDSGFGTDGVVIGATETRGIFAIDIDSTYMYVLGETDTFDWRIEKRLLSDGSLDSGFGTDGVVAPDATSQLTDSIEIDSTYMYLSGNDDNTDWRIEKRLLSDGSLDSGFGTDGVVTGAAISRYIYDADIDSNYIYAAGNSGVFDFRIEKRLLSDGSLSVGWQGESYTDVTTSTVIAYNDNSPTDGVVLTANANDPTYGTHTIVNQTYEELNNFTNSQAAIPAGQDGKWDFVLVDNSAPAGTAYCLRVVKPNSTFLASYRVLPEITTAGDFVYNCVDNDIDTYYGYNPVCCPTGNDCNDNDGFVNPGAEEVCDDGIDNNCNDRIDEGCSVCGDGYCSGGALGEDCFTCPGDCICIARDCSKACCGDGVCSGPQENNDKCPIDCH